MTPAERDARDARLEQCAEAISEDVYQSQFAADIRSLQAEARELREALMEAIYALDTCALMGTFAEWDTAASARRALGGGR